MNLKEIVLDLRVNHNLKGKYPVVIFTIPNQGGVYSGKKDYYVLTYRASENDLYFHHLKGFFKKRYDPKHDFSLRIDKFKYYTAEFMKLGGGKMALISYKNDYFPFGFFTGTKDSVEGQNNLQYIIDELVKFGIKLTTKSESDFKKGKTNNETTDDREAEESPNR